MKQTKIALSAKDNKRYILADNIETLPWGDFRVPNKSRREAEKRSRTTEQISKLIVKEEVHGVVEYSTNDIVNNN